MKYKFKQFTPVYVEWIDAGGFNNSGWQDIMTLEDDSPVVIVKTLGFYLKSTKYYVYLAQNYDSVDPTAVTNVERIPHGCIQKIKRIKL